MVVIQPFKIGNDFRSQGIEEDTPDKLKEIWIICANNGFIAILVSTKRAEKRLQKSLEMNSTIKQRPAARYSLLAQPVTGNIAGENYSLDRVKERMKS